MDRTPTSAHGTSPREPDEGPEFGVPRWGPLLATALAVTVAVGLAWYVAEGYRQSGGGTVGTRAPAAGTARPDGDGRGPIGTRRRSGRSRWLDIRAPVVTFPTLAGDTASLNGLRGQVVILNFWATWCPPCEREIPELVRLQDSLSAKPATVVGVAVSSGSRREIRTFGEEHGVNYPVWLSDAGTAATEYRAAGLPTTLLVDDRGIIRRRYMGPQEYETLRADVRALVDSASAKEGSRPTPRSR